MRRPICHQFATDRVRLCIEEAVRAALTAGRVSHLKPDAFRHADRDHAELGQGKRIVWDEGSALAWIIAAEGNAEIVITTLTRTEQAAA